MQFSGYITLKLYVKELRFREFGFVSELEIRNSNFELNSNLCVICHSKFLVFAFYFKFFDSFLCFLLPILCEPQRAQSRRKVRRVFKLCF